MSRADFLGRGWRFPIMPDASGALGYSEGPEHIEHSLRHILMTSFGERVMRPSFGCEAPDLVFAPGSVQYLRLLEASVRNAIRDFEPRVELEFASAELDQDEQNHVAVRIGYRIRGANSRGNLVFPFYLGVDEGPT
ncbi:phage baseplate protein [Massilia sp. CCM 8733]|uniref:Phage baseplate protein n=1 Tax=Massilia mucilaginosa TaxID=2609282 RepID=A0ABX0NRV9_9BURK|nr:GPW/gp25 family protein [Massilia mucilaginosa]NHZ89631.1 phage baseplate protein [Massilia mucilaginosa]